MRTLVVELGPRSYPIYIGSGLIGRAKSFLPHIDGHQVMIITNETVAPLYLETVQQAVADFEVHIKVLPDGEQYKSMDTLNSIFDSLLAAHCDRRATVIALGGGVVGDLGGFAAACYQRGIGLIQVPTTLLAQVDSSVGGKTAVNHVHGKNMIGAFYQPLAVVADTDMLASLPDREMHAGIAEVIKYGLIRDAEFFDWLEDNMGALLQRDPTALMFAIERSCLNKAQVVAADEREQGDRALLNFGHTFAHAIETATGYNSWLHGEAVAAGMAMAVDLSLRLKHIGEVDYERVSRLIEAAQLPGTPPADVSPQQFLAHMSVDKKVDEGSIRLVLLKSIGQAYLSDDYPPAKLMETLERFSTENA